ncbi:ABC transporter permease [Acuticoccus sp. 2012]|uniref:ABC transporter permease n=1 Tax=Acuticoccus mangrovi TaxID=2796142 RepID=A0A934MBG2_9HYPH|nr:ABC transporter permease [Acuticoccus mangrovi]MBJ3774087.1 ABC transporter permease [Acuticoccus mangrovi]
MDAHAPTTRPGVKVERDGDTVIVVATGAWTIRNSRQAEAAMAAVDLSASKLVFDLSGVVDIDTAGAWVIYRERGKAEFAGRSVKLRGADERVLFLLEEIELHIPGPDDWPRRPYWIVRFLTDMGEGTVRMGHDALALLSMLGVFGLRLTTAFTHYHRLRGNSILSNFDRACRGAVPIVMLMSFLVGLIIAQQAGFYLMSFGATLYVVDLSGILILREIGVLLAAILVAGRSGSAFTAEIGAMRMREEVDALHVLGLDPVEVLVVPRLMALMVAMPILAFLSDIAALFGAGLISWLYLGITPDIFMQRLNEAVTPMEFYIGVGKAPFMALIIGLVACNEGMKVGGSSESLGLHTTQAVVKAIFLVIVVDGLFAMFFAALGI